MRTVIWTGGLILSLTFTSLALVLQPLPGSAGSEEAGHTSPVADRKEILGEMRSDVQSTFDAVRSGVDAELVKIKDRFCSLETSELTALLARAEVDASARAEVDAKIEKILAEHLRERELECLFLVDHRGRVVSPLGGADGEAGDGGLEPTAVDRAALTGFAARFLRQRECSSSKVALPRSFVVTLPRQTARQLRGDAVGSEALTGDEIPRMTLLAIGVRPIWVRPDAPYSLLVGGVTMTSMIERLHHEVAGTTETDTEWHAFSVAGIDVPVVFAGGRVGVLVRRGLVGDLLSGASSERAGFTQVGPEVSSWGAIRSSSGELVGGWGVSVSEDGLASKLAPKADAAGHELPKAFSVFPVLDMTVSAVLVFTGVALLWILLAMWAKFVRPKSAVSTTPGERLSRGEAENPVTDLSSFHRSCRGFVQRTEALFDRSFRAAGVSPEDLEGPLRKRFTRLSERVGGFEAEFRGAKEGGLSISDRRRAGFDAKFKDFEETLCSFVAVLEGRWRAQHGRRADSDVQQVSSQYEAKLDDLEGVVNSAQTDGRKLAEDLAALRQVEKDLRRQLDDSNRVEFELRQKLEQTHLRSEQVALQENAAVRRLQEVESRASSLQKDLAKKIRRVDELTEQLAALEQREKVVNEELARLQSSFELLRDKEQSARQSNEKLGQDLAVLEQSLAESRDSTENLERRSRQEAVEHEEAQDLLAERNVELGRQVAAGERELEDRVAEKTIELRKKARELEARLQTLEEELHASRRSESGLREEKHAVETENAGLRERVEVERGRIAEIESQAGKVTANITAEVEVVTARAEAAAAETEEAVGLAEAAAAEREEAVSRAEAAAAETEEAVGLAEAAAAERAEAVSRAEAAAAEREEAVGLAEAAAAEREEAVSRADAAAAEREEAVSRAEAAATEREEAVSRAEAAAAEREEAVSRADAAAAEREEAVSRAEAAAVEREEAVSRAEAAAAETLEARETCAQLELGNAALARENEALRRQADNHARRLEEAEHAAQAVGQPDQSTAAVDAEPVSTDDTTSESSGVQHDRRDVPCSREELAELRAQIEDEREGNRRLAADRSRLQSRVEELEQGVNPFLETEVEPTGTAVVADDSGLREELVELEKEKVALQERLVAARSEVEILREAADGVRGFHGALVAGNLPTALGAVDCDGRVFVWNPAAERLWGLRAETVLGKSLRSVALKPEPLYQRLAEEVRGCVRDGRPSSTSVLSFETDGGDELHVRLFCEPVEDARGDVAGVIFSVEDVTESTTNAIESELLGQFQDTLAGSIPMALVITDSRHCVVSWNSHAEEILGVEEDDALGRSILDLPLRLSTGEFGPRFLSVCEEQHASRFLVATADDEECLVTVSPFETEEGELRGWMLLVEEVAQETP